MKKLLLTLLIIGLTGTLCTAALCGKIYYNEMQVYEDYQSHRLNTQKYDNIVIDSAVDTYIYVTEETPYVEFKQKFVDALGKHPEYNLTVETKNNTSYIKLMPANEADHFYFVTEDMAVLNIYLPKQVIDKLYINSTNNPNHTNWYKNITLDLQDMTINKLDIHAHTFTGLLSGDFNDLSIDANHGTLGLFSNKPAKVNLHGGLNSTLNGNYENINITTYNNTLNIDTQTPAKVVINGGETIKLNGKYQNINIITTIANTIDINSETLCKANIDSHSLELKIHGAFDTLSVKGNNTHPYITTTNIPKLINVSGDCYGISLMLPDNTPGIDASLSLSNNPYINFNSDFPLVKQLEGPNVTHYAFGNKQVKFILNAYSVQDIYIMNNGYESSDTVAVSEPDIDTTTAATTDTEIDTATDTGTDTQVDTSVTGSDRIESTDADTDEVNAN